MFLLLMSLVPSTWATTTTPTPLPTTDGCVSNGVVQSAQKISNLYGNVPYTIASDDQFGVDSTSVGDLDGDGVLDIVVGAPQHAGGSVSLSGAA